MAIVEVRHVSRNFRSGPVVVRALRDIDLDIEQGEFTAMVGPSGSGKTTLLNQIGALDRPDQGSIRIAGTEITGLNRKKLTELRLRKIGFVFQEYNLIAVLTALENVEYVMALQGVIASERRERALRVLHQVGLESQSGRRPNEMSGGQQQRVAVARAIVSNPSIVLADEPTANLDSKTGADLLDLMRSLNEENGITFLFSTHDPMVMERASRIIKLRDGSIVDDVCQSTTNSDLPGENSNVAVSTA